MFSEYRVFIGQFFRQYHTTGAILPSGRALAAALCRYVNDGTVNGAGGPDEAAAGPRRILEVGPGTGAVTARLAPLLRPEDRLTIVELNDDFVRHLRRRFEVEPRFQAVADRTEIVHARLEDLPGEGRYDRIISGLPLNNFAAADVEQILSVFARLAKPGGTLSFFEYIAVRRLKQSISGRAERKRLRQLTRILGDLCREREIRRDAVWPNITPAWVHHIRY